MQLVAFSVRRTMHDLTYLHIILPSYFDSTNLQSSTKQLDSVSGLVYKLSTIVFVEYNINYN